MIDTSMILPIVFALMVMTNMITEVIKKLTWDKIPTNIMVVVIAELLTIAAGAMYANTNNIDIVWHHVVGVVIVGVFVAYAAMFGFDKFRQTLEQVTAPKE